VDIYPLPYPPAKISGKYRVKFGYFVNCSYIYFRAKMSCPPPKLTELLYTRMLRPLTDSTETRAMHRLYISDDGFRHVSHANLVCRFRLVSDSDVD